MIKAPKVRASLKRAGAWMRAHILERPFVLAAAIVLVLVGSGGAIVSADRDLRHQFLRTIGVSSTSDVDQKSDANATTEGQISQTQADSAKPADPKKASEPVHTAGEESEQIKYSISSDPRSTAYSTTPPKPNPRSVDIRITRPRQVAVGTLIAYNPTKDETKVYYGGDLVFSPATVTIRKSQSTKSQNITVSTPGGAIADGMPGMPWYVTGSAAFAAFDSNAYTGPGTSWTLFLDLYYPFPAAGTYQVHVATTHNRSDNTALQYDGFITLIVTE
jgi:hypothetical protein